MRGRWRQLFDLLFVLAITQCTALMSENVTWEGIGQGMLVLALLWWSWTAYAWLTSVFDPEEGGVRLALFAAMASFLIASRDDPGLRRSTCHPSRLLPTRAV